MFIAYCVRPIHLSYVHEIFWMSYAGQGFLVCCCAVAADVTCFVTKYQRSTTLTLIPTTPTRAKIQPLPPSVTVPKLYELCIRVVAHHMVAYADSTPLVRSVRPPV